MITGLFACLFTMMFMWLSIGTIGSRRRNRIILGDGDGDCPEMRRWMRAQGNFVEYTIWFMGLFFLCEQSGVSVIILYIFGLLFFVSRIAHAYSLIYVEKYKGKKVTTHVHYRFYGMIGTFACIISLACMVGWISLMT